MQGVTAYYLLKYGHSSGRIGRRKVTSGDRQGFFLLHYGTVFSFTLKQGYLHWRLSMIETVPSGTVLNGRYRIERVLGSGGFGHVYVAVDLSKNQQYAVKEYMVTGSSGQEQLKHEARVLSQLHHPNLPAFQDAFIEQGRYYVVLNYIEGNDLTDLIRMTRQRNDVIPVRQMLNWLISICDAVMFLHSQNPIIIHRDIKPDNIRIMPNGTAVLVDLGNAKAAADGARTLFFIRHQGTPGYAPPEQYPGGSGTDARSDVYALGGTLYFALTAHEPPSVSVRNQSLQQGRPDLPTLQEYLTNNPPEESLEANAAKQFRLGVSKPSKPAPRHSRHIAQLGNLPPEVLNQLNRILQRTMALKPRDRYQYVADFANDLKNIIALLPPPSPPSSPKGPHSTQPDLPEIYDTVMAAKEQAKQDAPSAQPNTTCPRCGSSLAPNAAFCTRCGTSLPRPMNSQASTPNARVNSVMPDQTVVMTHAQMMQKASQQNPMMSRGVSSPNTPKPNQVRQQGTQNSAAQDSNIQSGQSFQQALMSANKAQQTQNNGAKIDPKLVIYFIIALVVLVILIVLLVILIQHSHATAVIDGVSYQLAHFQIE
jgi:serine/threonine protein kinase